jgi:hypothetical protein
MKTSIKYQVFLIGCLCFAQAPIFGQETVEGKLDSMDVESGKSLVGNSEDYPAVSAFLELGGRIYYTVNVDYRWNEHYSASIGLCIVDEVFPNVLFSRYFGKKHRIETGIGCEWVVLSDGIPGMFAQGLIGYRYQKKKGLIFRAGVYGLFGIPYRDDGRFVFSPLPGVSVGYCF